MMQEIIERERGQDLKMEMKDPSLFSFSSWFLMHHFVSLSPWNTSDFLFHFTLLQAALLSLLTCVTPSFLSLCNIRLTKETRNLSGENGKEGGRTHWMKVDSLKKEKVVTDERCPHESSSPSSSETKKSLLQHLICVVFSTVSLSSACKEIMMKTRETETRTRSGHQEKKTGIEDWSTRRRKKWSRERKAKSSLLILFFVSSLRWPACCCSRFCFLWLQLQQ